MMKYLATLIANPSKADLDYRDVEEVKETLEQEGYTSSNPFWIESNVACDIPFTGSNIKQAKEHIKKCLAGSEIDIVVQPAKNRRKKILVADMDSTIVEGETLDELAGLIGLKKQVSEITKRAMRGEIDFKESLFERVSLLKGIPVAAMEETLQNITLTPGAIPLVRTMSFNGAYTVLLSGGFSYFTRAIAKLVGFDEEISNELVVKNGYLTGQVTEPILDSNGKLEKLRNISQTRNIPITNAMAVGDGFNDIPMIVHSGIGVSFRGKSAVDAKADASIRFGDLTSLLYVQGYKTKDFCY